MSAATVGSARSVTAGPRESPTGEWCLRCWDKHRQRTAADAVLDDTPYCEPCALLLGFTPEEIAAARLLPKAAAAKPAAAEGGIGEEKMPERAAVDVAAGPSTAPQPSSALPAPRLIPGAPACGLRVCKIAGCGTPLKPKNTSGMCPKCYGRELYRRKRGLPGGALGPIQRKAAKAAAIAAPNKEPKAPKAAAPAGPPMPNQAERCCIQCGTVLHPHNQTGYCGLHQPPATVAESVSVQLPVALLDAWWGGLDAQAKADQFLEILSKALTGEVTA